MPCKGARATCCCPVWNKEVPLACSEYGAAIEQTACSENGAAAKTEKCPRRAPRTAQPLKPKVPAVARPSALGKARSSSQVL